MPNFIHQIAMVTMMLITSWIVMIVSAYLIAVLCFRAPLFPWRRSASAEVSSAAAGNPDEKTETTKVAA
jgi:hypothetical protein